MRFMSRGFWGTSIYKNMSVKASRNIIKEKTLIL